MEISALRNDLHGRIEQADEQELLKIYGLMLDYENSQADNKAEWDALPQWQQDRLLKSLKEADAGEGRPLFDVMKDIRSKYGL